jgi:hypothetical protein
MFVVEHLGNPAGAAAVGHYFILLIALPLAAVKDNPQL